MSDGYRCERCGWEWPTVDTGDPYTGWIYLKAELDMARAHQEDHLFDDLKAGRVAHVKREGRWKEHERRGWKEGDTLPPWYYKNLDTGEVVYDLYHYVETGGGTPYDGKPPRRPKIINIGLSRKELAL